jgi:hypothetical protein
MDLSTVEFYRSPIMPSIHNDAGLWGIPTVHYEFTDIADNLLPTALTVTYRLGQDISMTAELGPCVEREVHDGFFPYRYIQCPPQRIEVCTVGGNCAESKGGSVSGVTLLGGSLLIDFGSGVRAYNLMSTTFQVSENSQVAMALKGDPVREVLLELDMTCGDR